MMARETVTQLVTGVNVARRTKETTVLDRDKVGVAASSGELSGTHRQRSGRPCPRALTPKRGLGPDPFGLVEDLRWVPLGDLARSSPRGFAGDGLINLTLRRPQCRSIRCATPFFPVPASGPFWRRSMRRRRRLAARRAAETVPSGCAARRIRASRTVWQRSCETRARGASASAVRCADAGGGIPRCVSSGAASIWEPCSFC